MTSIRYSIGRRAVLKNGLASIALLTAATTLAGTGKSYAGTPDDTLVIAKYINDLISLDPAEVYEATGGELVNNLYERLLTFDPSDFTKVVGGAAENWTISADGLTYTFKIRDGLLFASGRPVTAADAAFSLQRVVRLGKTPSFYLTNFGFTTANVVERISAPDERTLVVTVDQPYSTELLLKVLTSTVTSVVDKQEVLAHESNGDLGYGWLRTASAGSGPYRLVTWKANEAVMLAANPHFGRSKLAVSNIILRHVPESATQRLLLEQGDVDIARNLSSDQIAALTGAPGIAVVKSPKTAVRYLALNQSVEAFRNPQVLKALRWAVDYKGITEDILKGQAFVHESFWGSGSGGSLDENPYDFDIAKAKSLLSEAGYGSGFTFTLDSYNSSPEREIAQSIQSSFGQAGIVVKLNVLDRAQIQTRFRARQHEAVFFSWSPDYLDIYASAQFFAVNADNSQASTNHNAAWRSNWDIPELSKQTSRGVTERDPAKRAELFNEVQATIRDASPFIFIYQEIGYVVTRDNVRNFIAGPSWDTPVYWLASKA